MKILELITEATDISDFGRAVFKEAIPEIDRALREYFKYFKEKGEEENPDDPVDGAYAALKAGTEDGYHRMKIRGAFRNQLSYTLQQFLRERFGIRFHVGKHREERKVSNAFVEFYNKIPGAKGQYTRTPSPENALLVEVATTKEQWEKLWREWFSEFISGNSTAQVLEEFFNEQLMSTLMHEVTHLVNDIMGGTHQNTALLKQGKGYHSGTGKGKYAEQILSKVGSNLFHLSRTSEIQTFASEIAWDLVGDVLTNPTYDTNPEHAIETLDYIIRDLSQGYINSSTLLDKKDLLDRAKTVSPKHHKQLERIWKKLLGQVVRNLEKYKQRIRNRMEEK